jgi:large subunit ribosomal protein L22
MATKTEAPELQVVHAKARYVRTAPRKVRLVVDQIRGLDVERAIALLTFSPRGASVPVLKLVRSAAANAENNYDLDPEEMRITAISVDEGPTMRRYRPRARGRATRIDKRSCHINISLTPIPDAD